MAPSGLHKLTEQDIDAIFDDHPSLNASLEDFEEDHHSHNHHLAARPPLFTIPSHHSGFRSHSHSGSEDSDHNDENALDLDVSAGPWSPPGFSRNGPSQANIRGTKGASNPNHGPSWYRHQPYNSTRGGGSSRNHRLSAHSHSRNRLVELHPSSISQSRSREVSPQYEDAQDGYGGGVGTGAGIGVIATPTSMLDFDNDITLPASIPLPAGTDSPLKGRSPSPERRGIGRDHTPAAEAVCPEDEVEEGMDEQTVDNTSNYIRFALRAEVQHREPFVAFFTYVRSKFDSLTKSRTNTTLSILIALMSLTVVRLLFSPPPPPPVPDMVKLSGLARSFEPLIFYSENGVAHIAALQETSVAVWDLGESVRSANMTSGPIIVDSLDNLSENLKTLALELTKFFANVDADVDSILIVMEWAKRELETLSYSAASTSTPTVLFDNVHAFLSRFGLLESSSTGKPTALGKTLTALFGSTTPQRTRATLNRTFLEFLSVLEESIASELTHSTALFTLFETIDRQFLNLQRSVVREADTQDGLEREVLASLWQRLFPGDREYKLRKFEKNRELLANVRARTVENKALIQDHRGRLLTLKANLEALRRKLVSPLVRRNESLSFFSSFSPSSSPPASSSAMATNDGGNVYESATADYKTIVERQIDGLGSSYQYLKGVRETQKRKLMEMVYGASSVGRRSSIVRGDGGGKWDEIDGR